MFAITALIAVVSTTAILQWLYKLITDPLKSIPGPGSTRFTKLWMLREYANGEFEKTNRKLHQKYGKIVRIAPNNYSVDDPGAAKVIYGHGTSFTKAEWYIPWGHPDFANLFNVLDPKEHAKLRRKVAGAYSMSSMVSYEPLVDECNEILISRLSKFADSGDIIDMRHWFQCFAFDMIGKINFSKRFGFLDHGEDINDLMKTVDGLNAFASHMGVFGSWFPQFVMLTEILGLVNPAAIIDNYTNERISNHQDDLEDDGPADFTSKLLKAEQSSKDDEKSDITRITANTNIVAGSDTTSISLSAILYNLCKNPECVAKLRVELEEGLRSGQVSDPITFREAQALPYLQAVIKEGLRVHPATGFTMPRVVPSGGMNILGHHFPAGTTLGVNAWVAHANTDVFGPDALSFRPERWIEEPERHSQMESYFLAFGLGARTCIGKNISLLEMSKALPPILQQFEFELEDVKGDWECQNRWFVKPKALRCRVRKRASPSL